MTKAPPTNKKHDAFISFASEDKDFVLKFNEKLREKGVNTWVYVHELKLSDTLPTEIFEKGLGQSDYVIIILSNSSINKPWTKKEQTISVVRQIEGKCKLIPIKIDDCEVPVYFQDTVRDCIRSEDDFNHVLDNTISAIFGLTSKPPLGERPKYTESVIAPISDLSRIGCMVLKLSCKKAIESFPQQVPGRVTTRETLEILINEEVPESIVYESLDELEDHCFIKIDRTATHPKYYSVTEEGFKEYLLSSYKNYNQLCRSVGLLIINDGKSNRNAIAESLNIPEMIINHILREFDNRGFLMVTGLDKQRCQFRIKDSGLGRWLKSD